MVPRGDARHRAGAWAVVIPTHNGVELTRRCLRAFRAVEGASDVELFVVDDGSTDGTARTVREEWRNARVINGDGSLWWTGAAEVGVRQALAAGNQRVLLLNNDNVEFSSAILPELGRALEEGASCASPIVLAENRDGGREVFQAGGALDWRGRGISMVGHGAPYAPSASVEARAWLPGCALAFTAETFLRVGGFAPRAFPQYRGDIDFTLRASRVVGPCVVVNEAWVLNDRSQTGLTFEKGSRLRDFLRGLVSLKSNYNLKETVGFAWKHCPRRLLVRYLFQFYARQAYGFVKATSSSRIVTREVP